MISNPTADRARPKQMENIVFGKSSPPKPAKVAKASSIRAKISGLPKFKATDARTGANAVNKTLDMVAPINDASAAAINAHVLCLAWLKAVHQKSSLPLMPRYPQRNG